MHRFTNIVQNVKFHFMLTQAILYFTETHRNSIFIYIHFKDGAKEKDIAK